MSGTGNMQQRIFDALAPAGKRTRLFDLYVMFPQYERRSVFLAVQRLCNLRLVRLAPDEKHPTYEVVPGATRPEERRGRPRKVTRVYEA